MHIRPEQPNDIPAVTQITQQAFQNHPHSHQTEHLIILALRSAGVLAISLVADQETQIVGHIAFSPVQISDGSPHWYGLGPVAVRPDLQRQGIGKALIHQGLATLRSRGAAGCVVLGEPSYYSRFGFKSLPDCILEGVPSPYFQVLSFGDYVPRGTVTYHAAFRAK